VVAQPVAGLEDARVAAWPVSVPRCQVFEQEWQDVVVVDHALRLAP